jgi:outer membrane protein, multidrug efflux system
LMLTGCFSWLSPDFSLPNITARDSAAADAQALPFVSPTVVGSWVVVSVSTLSAPRNVAPAAFWQQVVPVPGLDGLIIQALANNPDVQTLAARVQQADAVAGQALAAQLPTLGTQGSATRFRNSPLEANQPQGADVPIRNQFGALLQAGWEVDLWGRLASGRQAARLSAEAARAQAADVQLAVAAQVARTYVALLAAQQVEAAWATALAAAEGQQAIRSARYAAGELAMPQWQQAAAQLQQQRSLALNAASQTQQLRHALAALLGQAPGTLTLPSATTLPVQAAVPANVSASMLLQRPDVRAAALTLAAANAEIGAARAAFFPQVNLSAAGGFLSPVWGDVFDWNNRTWSAGPVLSLPLFQGGALRANLQGRWAIYEAQVAAYRGTVLNALRDAADAQVVTQAAIQQAGGATQALASVQRGATATQARYALGDVGKFEALDADAALAQATIAHAQALAGQWQSVITWWQALGGQPQ